MVETATIIPRTITTRPGANWSVSPTQKRPSLKTTFLIRAIGWPKEWTKVKALQFVLLAMNKPLPKISSRKVSKKRLTIKCLSETRKQGKKNKDQHVMATQEIKSTDWQAFCKKFLDLHRGAIMSVVQIRPGGARIEAVRELPLRNVW